MAKKNVQDDTRPTRLPKESQEYAAKREELLLAEIESVKSRERVAKLRRQLPKGATVDDYAFIEGPAELDDGDAPTQVVRLSELFTAAKRSLVIYHFMQKRQILIRATCSRISRTVSRGSSSFLSSLPIFV